MPELSGKARFLLITTCSMLALVILHWLDVVHVCAWGGCT